MTDDDCILARNAADVVLMSVDPRTAFSPPYWRRDSPKVDRFLQVLYRHRELRDRLAGTWAGLRKVPTDWTAHRATASIVEAALGEMPGLREELADALSRLHREAKMTPFRGSEMLTAGHPGSGRPLPPATRRPPRAGPHALTVILDLRARPGAERRLRNMRCVLAALHDQTLDPAEFRIVLVEQDEVARHRATLAPLVDHYLHVTNPGAYNRSWAHNVGAVHGPRDGRFLLFLDADFLIPATFLDDIRSAVESTGAPALMPYESLLYLDGESSDRAIAQRFDPRLRAVRLETMFGYRLRTAVGAAAQVVRRDEFFALDGYDERFEGWGSEDYEFHQRLVARHPVATLPDTLLHLDHPISASADVADANAGREHGDRPPGAIGRLDRYSTGAARQK